MWTVRGLKNPVSRAPDRVPGSQGWGRFRTTRPSAQTTRRVRWRASAPASDASSTATSTRSPLPHPIPTTSSPHNHLFFASSGVGHALPCCSWEVERTGAARCLSSQHTVCHSLASHGSPLLSSLSRPGKFVPAPFPTEKEQTRHHQRAQRRVCIPRRGAFLRPNLRRGAAAHRVPAPHPPRPHRPTLPQDPTPPNP